MKTNEFKTYLLVFLSICFLVACKKEQQSTDPAPEPASTISSKDPQAVSAAAKVWHGERMQGNVPAPKGAALVLDSTSSAPITRAFSGRYAIIQPQVAQGTVAGYYLRFTGAGEYFKVDYTRPRTARMSPSARRQGPFANSSRQSRMQDGNADSALVIVLPSTLKVPDTICVSYCAYDAQGNVSNAISNCIIVNSVGTDAANSWVTGTWKLTATWDSGRANVDTTIFNKWLSDPTFQGFNCYYDATSGTSNLTYVALNPSGGSAIVNDSLYRLKQNVMFATNGGWLSEYADSSRFPNLTTSTCSHFVFNPSEYFSEAATGAWNYNAATGKMTIIEEFDDNGTTLLQAWEYHVIKMSNNQMILAEDIDTSYPFYYRLEK